MNILQTLGQTPSKSFRYFILGVLFFAIGLGLVYFAVDLPEAVQITGLVFIGLGCILAIWGYIGIFSSRMLTMMNRHPETKD